MTPAEKRIAIAVDYGWNSEPEPTDSRMSENFAAAFPRWWFITQLPNYLGDLNAIQSAVARQSVAFQKEFDAQLRRKRSICLCCAEDWADIFLAVKQRQNKTKEQNENS